MTYARARLWLGITGVGSLVTIAIFSLTLGLPNRLLNSQAEFGATELLQLVSVTGLFVLWLIPLDFLGGFLVPAQYQKSDQKFSSWFGGYVIAAFTQALLFVFFGSLIILSSQTYGLAGGGTAICLCIIACFVVRNRLLLYRESTSRLSEKKLADAISLIQSWQIFVPRITIVKHNDPGFTGGIVGIGKRAQIVIPEAWLSFTRQQLAAAIARRAIAIHSGSYSRGLVFALVWNVGGFMLCSLTPEANLTSVAGLVTTICGFTLWSFIGLLTLPTLSRRASLTIDRQLLQHGMPAELIFTTALTMDQLQDGEPDRPRLIETIFHPVPNVSSRNCEQPVPRLAAWNIARTTLFFSWPCLGILSRSVHCNIGRPELWTMLPTD